MEMSESLPPQGSQQTELFPTASLPVFPAKTSALQDAARGLLVNDPASFSRLPVLLASWSHDTLSWKTSQLCLVEGSQTFSEPWPRSGMMQSGTAYQLQPLAPLTVETESGLWPTPDVRGFTNDGSLEMLKQKVSSREEWSAMSFRKGSGAKERLWPTPRANDAEKRGNIDPHNKRNGLPAAVKLWPTPQASDTRDRGCLRNGAVQKRMARGKQLMLSQVVSSVNGALNPNWVEWLMGYPIGHTDLKGLETP
jgi:hypothetical protein